VSFASITLCVTSQRVFIVVSVYFVMTQSGNFWIHPRITVLRGGDLVSPPLFLLCSRHSVWFLEWWVLGVATVSSAVSGTITS
jgi:hypothetical protein